MESDEKNIVVLLQNLPVGIASMILIFKVCKTEPHSLHFNT